MKQAVSVSLGSSDRDKKVEIELFGEQVSIERRGTDGDIEKAIALFTELDGKVDAFGVGGIDLWVQMGDKRYLLRDAQQLVKNVRITPVVDGSGLKNTLESHIVDTLVNEIDPKYAKGTAFNTMGVDRYGMTLDFYNHGYEMVCGDLMFGLGIPIPIKSLKQLHRVAKLTLPIATRLPLKMIYPTGEKQDEIIPKFTKYYEWADVIIGDCHYIKRHMPDNLKGKVIATNTTTLKDLDMFRERGVAYVVTTTPQLDGRSFGTNMMEAALTAVAAKNRPLTHEELQEMLLNLDMKPSVHKL